MFVSGGENVYPAEIRGQAACAFPAWRTPTCSARPIATWGRRPVAFVERDAAFDLPRPLSASDRLERRGQRGRTVSDRIFAQEAAHSVASQLSTRVPAEAACSCSTRFRARASARWTARRCASVYEQRIEVKRVNLYRIRLPFRRRRSRRRRERCRYRESAAWWRWWTMPAVRALSECAAFPTDWYLPETLDQDAARAAGAAGIPLVLNTVFLHPSEAGGLAGGVRGAPTRCPWRAGAHRAGVVGPVRQDRGQAAVEAHERSGFARGADDGFRRARIASVRSGVTVGAGAVVGLGTPRETRGRRAALRGGRVSRA